MVGQQRLTSDVTSDPATAEFRYEDVERFVDAWRRIEAGADAAETIERDYLAPASPGLRMFIEKYDLTSERLVRATEEHPAAYVAIADNLAVLRLQESAFRLAYASIAEVIPDAVFPPTWFLVGAHRGIGSGSIEGPLLTIEKDSAESIRTDLVATLVHEMVHIEQLAVLGEAYFEIFNGPGKTLLALSVREGIATFVSELITGGSPHKNEARAFLLANEQRLWKAFEREMLGAETGDWLWSDPADPEQPRDLGYAIGARIAEAYYRRAEDKRRAARELMAVTDYPDLLEASGYPD